MPSVTSCAILRGSATASTDEVGINYYSLRYIVATDGSMSPAEVANGALSSSPHPLPSMWSTYSYEGDTDPYSYAREYDVEADPKSVKLYYITVNYRPLEPGAGPSDSGNPIRSELNPINREPVYWWDREVFTERVEKDKDGKAIVNKAESLYPADIELERARGVLVIEFNVATLAEVIAISKTYDQAVNESTWTVLGGTVAPRAALCREVSSGPPMTELGYRFFHVVMRVSLAGEGKTWDVPKVELGRWHWEWRNGAYILSGGYRKRVDAGTIVGLKEDGTRKEDGAEFLITNWRCRPEANFNDIPS